MSRPADQVQLSVKAAPFAHVSVTAVDRSVYLVPSACSGSHLSAEYVRMTLYRMPGVIQLSS